jgi:hypothetical protein
VRSKRTSVYAVGGEVDGDHGDDEQACFGAPPKSTRRCANRIAGGVSVVTHTHNRDCIKQVVAEAEAAVNADKSRKSSRKRRKNQKRREQGIRCTSRERDALHLLHVHLPSGLITCSCVHW